MCGIAGIVPSRGLPMEKSVASVEQMLEQMAHRGPDGTYTYKSDKLIFGMVRLTIVGGETGEQPIWNESHTLAVVCNGEIYNYRSLRVELAHLGHTFRTESDIEVLVHLYEEYGMEFLSRVKGIFAMALWDTAKDCLIIARDRLGVKPLLYSKTYLGFAFASELRPLLSLSEAESFDMERLQDYHSLRFVPAPGTMIKDIHKLPPGHVMTVKNHHISIKSYWKLPEGESTREVSKTRRGRIEALRGVTRTAVRLQSVMEENLGGKSDAAPNSLLEKSPTVKSATLLSGGLDSSLLVALQQEVHGVAPDTITVSFDAPKTGRASVSEFDEQAEARRVAEYFGSKHVTNQYTAEDAWSALPRIIASLDEPIADPTCIPLWFASELAHGEGYRVLHSGEGVDELFGGYSIYRQTYWLRMLAKFPWSLRQNFATLLPKLHLPGTGAIERSLHPVDSWYKSVGNLFTEQEQAEIFRADILMKPTPEGPLSELRTKNLTGGRRQGHQILGGPSYRDDGPSHSGLDPLTEMLLFDCKTWLPDNTLAKSDKISMAHSIELRVPFLDEDLVEFAMSLPPSDKLRFGTHKYLVKAAFKDVLPASVLRRRKAGFPVPITAWIFGEWKDRISDMLLGERALSRQLYNRAAVEALLTAGPERTTRRRARLVFALVTMELWMASCATITSANPVFQPVNEDTLAARRLEAR